MTPHSAGLLADWELQGTILDVGGLDVNGSTKRIYPQTISLDMRDGRGVDVVAPASKIPFEDNYFDNVTCLDMLEHDETFWVSVPEMFRVLKPGGLFFLSVPTIGFHEHAYPSDYWRFTTSAVCKLIKNVVCMQQINNKIILAVGIKL